MPENMQYEPYVGILQAPPTKEERKNARACMVCGFEVEQGSIVCGPDRCLRPYRY